MSTCFTIPLSLSGKSPTPTFCSCFRTQPIEVADVIFCQACMSPGQIKLVFVDRDRINWRRKHNMSIVTCLLVFNFSLNAFSGSVLCAFCILHHCTWLGQWGSDPTGHRKLDIFIFSCLIGTFAFNSNIHLYSLKVEANLHFISKPWIYLFYSQNWWTQIQTLDNIWIL